MTTHTIRIKSGLVYGSEMERPERCRYCDGEGWTVGIQTGSTHGCCGIPNRDGSCCGNAIQVPTQEQVQEPCPCGGYDQALTRYEDSFLLFEDQFALRILVCVHYPETKIGVDGKQLVLKDGDYSLSMEVEVVTQQHVLTQDIEMVWRDVPKEWPLSPHNKGVDKSIFRRVLRLVDKKQ